MTTKPWVFLDFVDGQNRISEWLEGLPADASAEFEALLDILRVRDRLTRPDVGLLGKECDGLIEFIFKVRNIQYRPLACYGPKIREVTILMGATKKNDRFIPPNACRTALDRKATIQGNGEHVTNHVRTRKRPTA